MTNLKRKISSLLIVAILISIFATVPASAVSKGIDLPAVTYHVINAESGKYLSLYENEDIDEKSINLQKFAFDVDDDKFDREARQVFKFEKNNAGNYNIQPAMSSTRNIAPEAVPATSGSCVYLYSATAGKWQDWNVYLVSEGLYVIRNSANLNLVLSQDGSYAKVTTYKKGDKSQLWKFTEFSMRKEGDDEKIKSYGIDVSEHNGEINWEAVKEYGVDFAIIRIGYSKGTDTGYRTKDKVLTTTPKGTDFTYEENYKAARAAGIKLGAYIYSYATTVEEAKLDAEQVIKAVKGKVFEYPIYFDIEDDSQYNLTTELRTEMCLAFMNKVKAAGYQSGVYASQSWFDERLDHGKIAEAGSTWIAKWPKSDQADEDHSDYHLWQFRSDGNIGGIHGNVDVNVDYGRIENFIYTGHPIIPNFSVLSAEGVLLKEGVDYTATYMNNINVGTATVTYVGIGAQLGKLNYSRTFQISPRSLSDVEIGKLPERTYNGKAIIPSFTAKYAEKKLKKGTDYTVEGVNNVNAGEGTINMIGKGNFVGTRTIKFTIKKKNLKYADVTGIENKTYTGKKRTISGLKVKTSTTTLKKNKDYKVSYKNNKDFGTATITITGIGDNCRGTYKATFDIVPKAPESIKVSKATENSLKITWGESKYASRYQLYRATSKNGKYKKVYTTKSKDEFSYTNKGLTSGQHYFYKVRAYKSVDGKKYYSNWTEVKSKNTKLEDTTFTLAPDYNEKSITVKAKKNKDVGGYIVYMKKSGKYQKIYSGKSAKFEVEDLAHNKNYSFKIRTYKKTDYGTIYGTKSDTKSFKMVMPEAPEKLKASKKTTNSVKIKWKAVENAEVYQIYRATKIDGKYKRVKSAKSAGSFIDEGLKDGTTYYYKVRAYRVIDKEKCYGDFSEVTTVKTKLGGAEFTLTGNKETKSITVDITKNKNATGYIVYMYNSESKKFEKVWAGKDLQYVSEGLKTARRYNFKIRTYQKSDGKTIYGPLSEKKSLKIG